MKYLELSPREQMTAWETLEDNAAFQFLVDQVQEQIRLRASEILNGIATPENIYDREKLRGERAGMEQVLVMQQTMKEVAEDALDQVIKENRDEAQKPVL